MNFYRGNHPKSLDGWRSKFQEPIAWSLTFVSVKVSSKLNIRLIDCFNSENVTFEWG